MQFRNVALHRVVLRSLSLQSMALFAISSVLLAISLDRESASATELDQVQPTNHPSFCPAALPSKVQQILQAPHLQRTRWGLSIHGAIPQSKSDASRAWKPLYEMNEAQLFLPASTAKLFTTAAVLTALGPDYRLKTQLVGIGTPPNLQTLRVIGQGDPSLTTTSFVALAQQLRQRGVQKIQRLVGDDRAFAGNTIIPRWDWEDLQTSDGVPINSLSFNQNSLPVTLTPTQLGQPLSLNWPQGKLLEPLVIHNRTRTVRPTDPEFISLERNLSGTQLTISGQLRAGAAADTSYVAIAEPGLYFLKRLREVLSQHQIQVQTLKLIDQTSPEVDPIPESVYGAVNAPPIKQLIRVVNQDSNNFYAESLLRSLGAHPEASKKAESEQANFQNSSPSFNNLPFHEHSLTRLKQTLSPLGVDANSYFLRDG